MQKGYKYRIYPNTEQRVLLARTFGCVRFTYNSLLAQSSELYKQYKENPNLPKPNVSGFGLALLIPKLKTEFEFLEEVSYTALQQTALQLGTAFTNFFKGRGRYPKFKSKRNKQSFRLVGASFNVKDGSLYVAKSKAPMKLRWSRPLPSAPSSVVISQEPNGNYYASFVCEYEPEPTNGSEVLGLDLGIKSFYIDSNGDGISSPNYLRKTERRLTRAQRSLSRKKKGSNNRNKARLRVAKLHAKTKQQRNDFLHKLSRDVVNKSRMIAIEDLNVKGMLRNRNLAKSISDLGWGNFIKYLQYKTLESRWCTLVRISRWYPSTQTCSECSYRLEGESKLNLGQRFWTCPSCNTAHDRDVNAAKNIRREAIRLVMKNGQSAAASEGKLVVAEAVVST